MEGKKVYPIDTEEFVSAVPSAPVKLDVGKVQSTQSCQSTRSWRDVAVFSRTTVAYEYFRGASLHAVEEGKGIHLKAPSLTTAVAAAVINWLLMFGLCCAYGMIMFSDDWNQQHRALGVKMNLATATFMGILLACASKVPVAIGGPDLNPVVFLGGFASKIAADIALQLDLAYPSNGAGRRLGGAPSGGKAVDFCLAGGAHMTFHQEACEIYHEELRATMVFTVAVSSAAIGGLFFVLGWFRLTRYVSYVPTCVMEAFLSCVGYKVFKYALTFCVFEPVQFIPAACVGVPLYFMKAHHIGNPALVIPVMLLVPLALFYAYVLGVKGSTIEAAREDQFMFPHMDNVDFFRVWLDSLGKAHRINFKAFATILPDLAVMIVVVLLDCLLKISSTEAKLPLVVDKDYEICLYGLGNFFTVASGSTIGYMQLKFNVINFGVMGNVFDRRAGLIYATLCGICFFGTMELFNFFPRFWLGTLLFFAGAGFVAENLWGSRKFLNFHEWMQIFIIVGFFILSDSLLYAVLIGGLLTGADFIRRYSGVPCIFGRPLFGGDLVSIERKSELQYEVHRHIAQSWLLVIRLKGYVFFASAQVVTDFVRGEIDTRARLPKSQRCRYVLFDCMFLDGLDASASKALGKFLKEAKAMNVEILWSDVNPAAVKDLVARQIVRRPRDVFLNLERAVLYVEEATVNYSQSIQDKWLKTHPALQLCRGLAVERSRSDPFDHVLTMDSMRQGCPWRYVTTKRIVEFKTVLYRPGETTQDLFLVHTGAVGLFEEMPDLHRLDSSDWGEPIAIYRHGWFLNRESRMDIPSRHYAVALASGEVLCWTESNWFRMCNERPFMAAAFSKVIMRQQVRDDNPEGETVDENKDSMGERDVMKAMESLSQWRRRNRRDADDFVKDANMVAVSSTRSSGVMSRVASRFSHVRTSLSEERKMSTFRDMCCEQGVIPEDLQKRLSGTWAARALERMHLFDPIPPGAKAVLPSLPESYLEDLTLSFNTYSVEGVVLWENVQQALMYAGVFNTLLVDTRQPPLSYEEFITLGHRAIMAPFSEETVKRIHEIFNKHDQHHSGLFDPDALLSLFRQQFDPSISIEEVDGLFAMWDDGTEITSDKFVAIMSRFIRTAELDWCLVRGFWALTGGRSSDKVTVDDLVANSRTQLTEAVAEEMIWASDWNAKEGNTKQLDFKPLVGNVLLELRRHSGTLPPPPALPPGESKARRQGSKNEAWLGSQPKKPVLQPYEPTKVSKYVVDLRDVQDLDTLPTLFAQKFDQWDQEIAGKVHHMVAPSHSSMLGVEKEGVTPMVSESTFSLPPGVDGSSWKVEMHLLWEEPSSSSFAKWLSLIMGCLILLSVMTLVIEPLTVPDESKQHPSEEFAWAVIEVFFTVIFTAEYAIRFFTADALKTNTMWKFFVTPSNMCDLLAIVPWYIEEIVALVTQSHTSGGKSVTRLLRVVRLMRLLRVLKLAKLSSMGHGNVFGPVAMVLTLIWGIYMKARYGLW
eukprot:TRINITY_DN17633_c0_g1_i1.p1 TRINITY_DN17633_c0_g1~~TRINITY_DN17633_c0_g1_i1.p1  ORF type:complete len:1491 (-),score=256.50 TRINITY_DN17633_c0_g1_i1:185-4657(-)